jgi:hypothetical protein
MAEVEISVLTEQCLDRRLGSQGIVASKVGAWESEWNAARATIDWRFTIPNARDQLKELFPVRDEQRLAIASQRFGLAASKLGRLSSAGATIFRRIPSVVCGPTRLLEPVVGALTLSLLKHADQF